MRLHGMDHEAKLWRLARVLIAKHGKAAPAVAHERAQDRLDKRDYRVASIWASGLRPVKAPCPLDVLRHGRGERIVARGVVAHRNDEVAAPLELDPAAAAPILTRGNGFTRVINEMCPFTGGVTVGSDFTFHVTGPRHRRASRRAAPGRSRDGGAHPRRPLSILRGSQIGDLSPSARAGKPRPPNRPGLLMCQPIK